MELPNQSGSIEVCRDAAEVSRHAAEHFVNAARECQPGGRFSVALSGGSTPKVLYSLLASAPYREQVLWEMVHVFWGDERCVPPDHADSNYRMAHEALLSQVPIPPGQIYRIGAEEDPAAAAARYGAVLESTLGTPPRFDLVLLGMGDDGHTASLFPGTTALADTEHLVAAPYVEKFKAHRVTLTSKVINNAARVMFLISGASKAPVLQEVLEGPYEPDRLPSQLIRPTGGRLLWLVDQAAASQLTLN